MTITLKVGFLKNVPLSLKLNLRRDQEVRQFMTSRHIFKVRESRGGRPQTIHIHFRICIFLLDQSDFLYSDFLGFLNRPHKV